MIVCGHLIDQAPGPGMCLPMRVSITVNKWFQDRYVDKDMFSRMSRKFYEDTEKQYNQPFSCNLFQDWYYVYFPLFDSRTEMQDIS